MKSRSGPFEEFTGAVPNDHLGLFNGERNDVVETALRTVRRLKACPPTLNETFPGPGFVDPALTRFALSDRLPVGQRDPAGRSGSRRRRFRRNKRLADRLHRHRRGASGGFIGGALHLRPEVSQRCYVQNIDWWDECSNGLVLKTCRPRFVGDSRHRKVRGSRGSHRLDVLGSGVVVPLEENLPLGALPVSPTSLESVEQLTFDEFQPLKRQTMAVHLAIKLG